MTMYTSPTTVSPGRTHEVDLFPEHDGSVFVGCYYYYISKQLIDARIAQRLEREIAARLHISRSIVRIGVRAHNNSIFAFHSRQTLGKQFVFVFEYLD